MEFFITIRDGQILNKKRIKKAFDELKDGTYQVKIESAKKRSLQQNKYYFGCVLPMAKQGFNDIGYDEIQTTEDVHEIFKSLFIKRHFENKDGLVMEYVGTTTKLSTFEFMEYIDKIAKFCAENLSIAIPAPGESLLINF